MRTVFRDLIVQNDSVAGTNGGFEHDDADGLGEFDFEYDSEGDEARIEAVGTDVEEESTEVLGFNPLSNSRVSHDFNGP